MIGSPLKELQTAQDDRHFEFSFIAKTEHVRASA